MKDLMCAEELSEPMVDSLFRLMKTAAVLDSAYQVNLHVYGNNNVFTRSLFPERNVNTSYKHFANITSGSTGNDCVQLNSRGEIVFGTVRNERTKRYYSRRMVAQSSLQKIELEYIIQQY